MKKYSLGKEGIEFLKWSRKFPVGRIPTGVAKEGAGENRIPFAHLANSVPVYLSLLKLLKLSKNKKAKILDVGCGTGRNISFVKHSCSNIGPKFYGIDYSVACIDFARKQYKKFGVEFVQHNGKKMPFKNKTFDYIVSSHVVEHIPKDQAPEYFSEISRILKDGGVAIIGTPNRKYCQDLFKINPDENIKFRLILPHIHEYYYDELKKLFGKNKWFKKFRIDQTVNLLNRKLMTDSINKVKPGRGVFNRIKFEIYSEVRKIRKFQDIMAKVGTEYILKKMNVNYEDLIKNTYYISGSKVANGDNFIIRLVK